MIDLNCRALIDLTHAVLPGMIAARRGAILNVASTAALQPGPWMAVYYATKAFVLSFSEALHEEMKPHKIGRASCRERVCQYVWISVVAGSLKKKYLNKVIETN